MNVLIVTTGFPRNSNDMAGIFIKRLAVSLVRRGIDITILAPGHKNAKPKEIVDGIKIVRFWYAPSPLMKLTYGNGGIPENLKTNPWLYIIIPFFIISLMLHLLILSKDIDIIHANWLLTGLFVLPAARLKRIPIVITLRGSDLKKQTSLLFRLTCKNADVLTTVNQHWMQQLKRTFGDKVFYTPNGVSLTHSYSDIRERYKIRRDEIIAVFIGTLTFNKGIDIIGKAAERMKNSNLRFVLIGPGDPAQFGLVKQSNILCIGPVAPNQVMGLLKGCDIFILTSRHEGRPNALLEAMASGIPSIVTALPGILEIFTSQCGIIIDVEDVIALEAGLRNLANHPEKRLQMGINSKLRIKELCLDWNTCASNYIKIFESLNNVRNRRYCCQSLQNRTKLPK